MQFINKAVDAITFNPFKLTEGDLTSHTLVIGPTRLGMSVLTGIVTGQLNVVSDIGRSSSELMRVCRKRNDRVIVQPKAKPYYRQFDKRKF